MSLKITLLLLFLLTCFHVGWISTQFFKDECKPTDFNEWCQLGQLYSFCMQIDGKGEISPNVDPECESKRCKLCVNAACKSKGKNGLQRCLSECNANVSCQTGCKYYNRLLNNNFQNGSLLNNSFIETALRPSVSNGTISSEDLRIKVIFNWNDVATVTNSNKITNDSNENNNNSTNATTTTNNNSITIQSIYLVTLILKNGETEWHRVLGLTSRNRTERNIFKICGNVHGTESQLNDPGTVFRLKVYPINYNGWNNSTYLRSAPIAKNIGYPSQLTINGPEYYYENLERRIRWPITYKGPQDGYLRRIEFVAKWRTKECSELFPANKRQSYGDLKRNDELYYKRGGAKEIHELTGCIGDVQFYSKAFCLTSTTILKRTFQFNGCENLTTADAANAPLPPCPYVPVTTTPIPDYFVPILSMTATEVVCTNKATQIDQSNNKTYLACDEGYYIVHITWSPKYDDDGSYELRWGFYGDKTPDRIYAINSQIYEPNSSLTSYNINISTNFVPFNKKIGVRILTDPNNLRYQYNYTFIKLDQRNIPKGDIDYDLSVTRTSVEECVSTFTVKCFHGDSMMACKQCNDTTSYSLTAEWNRKGNSSGPFLLRWGPTVRINDVEIILDNIELGRITTNRTIYIINNLTRIYPSLGVQIHSLQDKRPLSVLSKNLFIYRDKLPEDRTDEPSSTGKSKETGKDIQVAVGIIIPFALIIISLGLVCLYMQQRKRRSEKIGLAEDECNRIYSKQLDELCDEWEIQPTAITLDQKIGEGAFGKVYSATLQSTTMMKSKYSRQVGGAAGLANAKDPKVAVKLLREGASHDEWSDFKEEIDMMKTIGYHKNIVNMIGCSTVRQPVCLIVEFMQHGDLLKYLRKKRSTLCTESEEIGVVKDFMYTKAFQDQIESNSSNMSSKYIKDNTLNSVSRQSMSCGDEDENVEEELTPNELLCFAWQIASGMEYLSNNGIVHRDLAARNILIGSNKVAKISDFGLAKKIGTDQIYMSQRNRRLPIKWMSVEAIFNQEFTTHSDVWSYGVVLFEIVTLGGTPHPKISNRELLELLKSGYRMEKPDNCADPMYHIMLRCWNESPQQRPSFSDLREHLEEIMSQGDRYLSFNIDEGNIYYNVASFRSIPSDNEDEINEDDDELHKMFDSITRSTPKRIKSIEELKNEANNNNNNNDHSNNNGVSNSDDVRYVTPASVKDKDMILSSSLHSDIPSNGYVNAGFILS